MKKAFSAITEYLLLFMLAAFLGWLYEIGCVYVMFHHYQDRGVLHLPMCPIYGFGILLLLGIFRERKNIFLLFFGSALIATAIELAACELLRDRVFSARIALDIRELAAAVSGAHLGREQRDVRPSGHIVFAAGATSRGKTVPKQSPDGRRGVYGGARGVLCRVGAAVPAVDAALSAALAGRLTVY